MYVEQVLEEEMHDVWKNRIRQRKVREIIKEYTSLPRSSLEKAKIERKKRAGLSARLGPGTYEDRTGCMAVKEPEKPSLVFTKSTQPFDIRMHGAIKGGGLTVQEEFEAERRELDHKGFRPPKTEAEHQRLVRFYTDQSVRKVSIPFSKRGMSPSRAARSLHGDKGGARGTLRSSSSAPQLELIPALTLRQTLPERMRDAIPAEGLKVTPRRNFGPQISFGRSRRF